jgi:isochorismate synthase
VPKNLAPDSTSVGAPSSAERVSSVRVRVREVQPEALDRAVRTLGEADFAFRDPLEKLQVRAHGYLKVYESRGRSFSAADRALGLLRALPLSDPAPVHAFVGFAFDPSRTGRLGPWSGFPSGFVGVPRTQFTRRGDRAWISSLRFGSEPEPTDDGLTDGLDVPELPRMQAFTEGHPSPWKKGILAILAAIERGELSKAVLARELQARFDGPVPRSLLFPRLCGLHPSAFAFAVKRGEAMFAGATPELLFRKRGDVLETMALAGSVRRGATPAEDAALGQSLLDSDKDRREHQLVVDAITSALAPLSLSVEQPQQPRVKVLARIQHLETPLKATLRPGVKLSALLEALHPTPAVCGTPRDAARALIARCEPFDRGWYAGPVGLVDREGNAVFAVALRSFVLQADRATFYAGAGIVKGSDADAEWAETSMKARSVLGVLDRESP